MRDTMLEKAARAAAVAAEQVRPSDEHDAEGWSYIARAVLMAVRESGQEMRKVSDDMRIWEHGLWTDASSSETFTAMIDAILGQEPGA